MALLVKRIMSTEVDAVTCAPMMAALARLPISCLSLDAHTHCMRWECMHACHQAPPEMHV